VERRAKERKGDEVKADESSLLDSYRNLTASLVETLIQLSPTGRKVPWLLDQIDHRGGQYLTLPGDGHPAGLHEGTDAAIADFCRATTRPARVMRLVSAEHARRLRTEAGITKRFPLEVAPDAR
jgi:hypothetical protein